MASSPPPPAAVRPRGRRTRQFLLRAPSPALSSLLLALLVGLLAAVAWLPMSAPVPLLPALLAVFVLPTVAGVALTTPLASVLGGWFPWRRSLLLSVMGTLLSLGLLLLWRVVNLVPAIPAVSLAAVLLLLQGPVLWFRQMTLFGVSRPSHARSLPAALLPPLVAVVGVFYTYPPTSPLLVAGAIDLFLGFGSAVLLLRAADRPLRREFSISGVSLIRPLMDHVNQRDPAATEEIERFFRRFAIPANLRVTLLSLATSDRTLATVVLPTVHPGPFAALGASDLPQKMGDALEPAAGVVLVPHSPCNHDLDLPPGAEVPRVATAARELLGRLPAGSTRISPLVAGREGAIARAQVVGDSVLVVVTQAPAPTDDIDFSVADQLFREYEGRTLLAIVDAHNSYVEDQGDLIYGTPAAHRMLEDARLSIAAALDQATDGPLEAGVAVAAGYSTGEHGIGPHGIRALVLRGAGKTTAYVLIDGNNLLLGLRERILASLGSLVDTAEIWTTDNHVVHEVDGTINAVGERYSADELAADIREVIGRALAGLAPVEARAGYAPVPSVPVLGPGWTARLLTSLSDTLSMFTNALLMTFLLLLAGSVIVLLATR